MIDANRTPTSKLSATRERELRESIELLFFGYRAFTAGPDAILAKRGLGRAHHRILYFVGREPGLTVAQLLAVLSVTKQALNAPLRQLLDDKLIASQQGVEDKRIRQLSLTATGKRLEAQLTGTQLEQLDNVFSALGSSAEKGWHQVMRVIKSEDLESL